MELKQEFQCLLVRLSLLLVLLQRPPSLRSAPPTNCLRSRVIAQLNEVLRMNRVPTRPYSCRQAPIKASYLLRNRSDDGMDENLCHVAAVRTALSSSQE